MTGAFRTAQGGVIDRNTPVRFTFDGRGYTGFAGDTLASALLANGVHLLGRSFKYHRPRGIMAAGADEPNALVRVGATEAQSTPNLRATQVEIYDGLVSESQNRFPSLRFDVGAINDIAAPFLPAGFYYKTFMWPAWGWRKLYEPVIRQAAGLGRAPAAADTSVYAQRFAHCDVLVVGAGVTGLAASGAAVAAGARVIVCDEQAWPGNAALPPGVVFLPRTTAFGIFAQNFAALAERVTDHLATPDPNLPRERLWQIRAKQIVLATGAIERPMVFPGNDRPGIMLAGAARTYVEKYGVLPGSRAVVVTQDDAAYTAAQVLAAAGVQIAAIVDRRPGPHTAIPGTKQFSGAQIAATAGRLRVRGITVQHAGGRETIPCDLVLMSGGFTPSVHLYSQAGGTLKFDSALGAYVPDGDTSGLITSGACRGIMDAAEDGAKAGSLAAAKAGFGTLRERTTIAPDPTAAPPPPAPLPGRAFVDFQNDVTTKDLALALREGFVSVEHVKRYTTLGMATDQGKTSNINGLGVVAAARAQNIPQIGLTTYRMPYTPVTFGTLAGAARGDLFDPVRQTPIHAWAQQQGAVFEDVGLWKRARYFPSGAETMHEAVARECLAVRAQAGIFDASTLGKIEVCGPDAATFLERMYINGLQKLAVGKIRYGVLLGEDGFIMDDGVIGRLSKNLFHVTTTTGGAPRVLAMMEDYLQTEWPDLQVWLTSTTEEWAVIAVQGPHARDILAPLLPGMDISARAMPHMSLQSGQICGVDTRLFRVSFSGELGFEINLPSGYARMVWDEVWAAGQNHGMVAYGTETMHVLRAEKGFLIVGQETDGTVTPDDVGLAGAINRGKKDFVGKRSLARAAMAAPVRKQLVGLLTTPAHTVLQEGAQIVAPGAHSTSLGHVTSAYYSATLGKSIALAMLAGGRGRLGEDLLVPMPGGAIAVKVVSPVFYDPRGERVNG